MTDRPDFDETWLRSFHGADEANEVFSQIAEAAIQGQRAARNLDIAQMEYATARCVALTKHMAGVHADMKRLKSEIQARG